MMIDGLHLDVSRADYDAIERLNWSRLRHMKRSPAHYRAHLTKPIEETDAMRVGRATHVATLEPEKFRAQWAVWDGGARRGKEWERFERDAKARGIGVLTADQYETVHALSSAALTDEHAARFLRGGRSEVTLLWTDAQTGIACKARPDFAAEEMGALVDLKTTKDASPDGFAKACWNLDYLTQAAWYVDGHEAATGLLLPYFIVAVESSEPHIVQVYRVTPRMLAMGRAEYRNELNQYVSCRESNRWPGYADGPIDLELPRWVSREDETDLTGMDLVVSQ